MAKAKIRRGKTSVILGVTGTLELVIPLGARLGHPHWRRALKDAGVAAEVAEDVVARISESYVPWQENSFPGLLGNVVAGRIANRLDLHGTNCVVDAACASSLSAVHLAAMELATGKADVVVTGGADTFNDIFMFLCFSKTPALSKSGESRPFDANGDGTALGEGLGMIVLKRLADAEAASDSIYAVLKGIGTSSDGKGNAIYAPSSDGQERCLRDAYSRAGVNPATVELVEAHGTGTKVGDAAEATALTRVFGASGRSGGPWCALGSVKSQIGHTKAAAGAASLIKVALALHNKVLPPTLKVNRPVEPLMAPDCPFYVNAKMRPWLPSPNHPRRAGISAFGFGGSNFHAVLEEYQPEKTQPDWDGQIEIVAVSGRDETEVIAALNPLGNSPDWPAFARFAEITRSTFSHSAPVRLLIVAKRDQFDPAGLLKTLRSGSRAEKIDGVDFGRGPSPGKLAVLFPGQGSQRVGMLRELACTFPEMLESLTESGKTSNDAIYPPTSFADGAAERDEQNLRATNHAQPALGAVSFGGFRVLSERFGVRPDCFAGHSYGELPALAAAGRLERADFYRLSKLRGDLMAQAGAGGDAGSMLAVLAPLEVLDPHRLPNVVIANKNSPKQTVLSGRTADLEKQAAIFEGQRIRSVKLPVAAAFHSELVAEASRPFFAALGAVAFPSGWPVYSNTTAEAYPADEPACRELLGNQLARPVEFVEQIRAMHRDGVRTFVEVGPGTVLTKLVQSILDGSEYRTVSLESNKPNGLFDLASLLAQLAALGYPIDLSDWERGSRCRPAPLPTKPVMTVPIGGANVVQPRPKRPARPPSSQNSPQRSPMLLAGTRPMNEPQSAELRQALQMTQQTLAALQKMQEQTAQLHKQFLESQESAQRTLHQLVSQQQSLYFGTPAPGGSAVPPVAMPTPLPPPPVVYSPPPVLPVLQPARPVAISKPAAIPGVAETLLAVVAEKTGYPVDLLNLGMSLDSDLGVDSIKRVEILSALQDKLPSAPIVKPEHLGTLHTLQDVADFLQEGAAPLAPQLMPRKAASSVGQTVPELSRAGATIPFATRSRKIDPLFFAEPPVTLVGPVTLESLPAIGGISATLLGVVAEKTGYPVDLLNLDMSLDNDLGVDSIKRVEILSALQDKLPNAPVVKPEHLGTLHTLRDVADFLGRDSQTVSELAPKTEPISEVQIPELPSNLQVVRPLPRSPDASASASRSASSLSALDRIDRSILQVSDIDLTVPRPKIALALRAEIWIVAGDENVAGHLHRQFQTAGYAPKIQPWAAPPAVPEGDPHGLVVIAPPNATQPNRIAFQWLRAVAPKLRQTGRASFAVSVAQLDGSFGLTDVTVHSNPALGGLAGLLKTARLEWPEVACKAIDLAPAFAKNPAAAAVALADEAITLGPVEVGVSESHRCTIELARTVRKPALQPLALGPKDVILITGGARGVTAEVAGALAETFKPTLILTGRTPAPTAVEPDATAVITDEAALKKAIAERLGATATPKTVSDAFQKLIAQREIRATLARLERAGSKAVYLVADVANPRQVADLFHQIQVKHGGLTGLIHGAGVLADKRIEELTDDQFDRVYSTKVDGIRNLLDILGGQELKLLVLFSSTTARLGRIGQAAYAAANEVLNKTAQVESRRRPNTRVVAINWGPWEGGMVNPALRKVFETEGVGLIPLEEGGAFAVQELNLSGRTAEVVALGKNRPLKQPNSASGSASAPPRMNPTPALVTGPPLGELTTVFERTIDLVTHTVLRSHIIDGRAVVPMALHMEWLAHAALHGNPGLLFHGFNEMRVTSGVQIEESISATIRVVAGRSVKSEKNFLVPVELRGRRRDGREVIHSKAEVVLTAALPKPPAAAPAPDVSAYPHPLEEIYRYFLFHGPDLHAIERIDGISEGAYLARVYPAPAPGEWMIDPPRSTWLADPLAIDASFQLMILWSYSQHGSGSLPGFAGRYRQYRRSFGPEPVRVQMRITKDNGNFARADIDFLDAADGTLIAQIQDYECVIDAQLNQAFRRNQLAPRGR